MAPFGVLFCFDRSVESYLFIYARWVGGARREKDDPNDPNNPNNPNKDAAESNPRILDSALDAPHTSREITLIKLTQTSSSGRGA